MYLRLIKTHLENASYKQHLTTRTLHGPFHFFGFIPRILHWLKAFSFLHENKILKTKTKTTTKTYQTKIKLSTEDHPFYGQASSEIPYNGPFGSALVRKKKKKFTKFP